MVLGPGGLVCNIVSCNASVFIELLDAHFFTHNDWMETSFHFIAYVDSISLVCVSFIFPLYQTLLLQPIDASISHFNSLHTVAYFCYCHYFSFHCIEHYCCHSLFATIYPFVVSFTADDTPLPDSKQEGHGLP